MARGPLPRGLVAASQFAVAKTPWQNSHPHAGGVVKVRDVIKMLEDDGWSVVRQRGSHRQFKHNSKPGLLTLAGKPGDDLAPGTLNSVLKQARVKP